MSIRDLLKKIDDINRAIETIDRKIDPNTFRGQEPLQDAIDLLEEYREYLLDTKINI